MTNKTVKLNVFSLLLLFFFSCNSHELYKQKFNIKSDTWEYNQTIQYSWEIVDTISRYDIILAIDHIPDLHFRNLYIQCKTTFPDQNSKDQIVSLELYDETGKPYGDCSNSKCTTEILLQTKIRFPFPGKYDLAIDQFSRDLKIPGIHSLELKIMKTNSDKNN
ncbi:MAG: gliding motility lipoprotein GldH [Saprospiraceae bacterium]|nr:gliding motility lipoprotein GldH [Saprospiraceae bacterium]